MSIEKINQAFKENSELAKKVIKVEYDLKKIAIEHIKTLRSQSNASQVDTVISKIEEIKSDPKLGDSYDILLNQVVVLLVSYFGSTVSDIYKYTLGEYLSRGKNAPCFNKDFKTNIKEISIILGDPKDKIGKYYLEKCGHNFQNLRKTIDFMNSSLGLNLKFDKDAQNVAASQAVRHVIVHASGETDEEFMKDISFTSKKTIYTNIPINYKVVTSDLDIENIISSMEIFLNKLKDDIYNKLLS